ncbi:MAG TPA: SHD1 domain-containing protein [Bacteroidia bacterium]|nr:SHD1 domain-containing protein [Bacteroidia bacterium]
MRLPPLSPFLAIVVLIWGSGPAQAEVREWTRASDGKKISAEFVGMKTDGIAKIKLRNGQIFEVPVASLVPEDAEYLASLQKGGGAKLPAGETVVTLSGVHLCCASCEKAVTGVAGAGGDPLLSEVQITCDRDAGTVAVKAPSGKAALAALEAMHRAGFYGVSDHSEVAMPELDDSRKSVGEMEVSGLHLCCGGCVKALTDAVKSVDGVEACEAKRGDEEAKITGKRFSPREVMAALRSAGFGGEAK